MSNNPYDNFSEKEKVFESIYPNQNPDAKAYSEYSNVNQSMYQPQSQEKVGGQQQQYYNNYVQNNQPPIQNPQQNQQPNNLNQNFNNMNVNQGAYYNQPQQPNFGSMPDYMNNTKVLMNNIDISCDDHKKNNKSASVPAVRYCSKCNSLLCDECIIDYHIDHIQDSKMKLNDYFSEKRKELEELKQLNYSHIQHKKCLEDVEEKKIQLEKKTNTFFTRKIKEIDDIKAKLDLIKLEHSDIREKIKNNINTFFHEECYKRMEKPLTNLQNCDKDLIKFMDEFDAGNKVEKVNKLKSNQLINLKNSCNEYLDNLSKNVNTFINKSRGFESKLDTIFSKIDISKVDEIFQRTADVMVQVKESGSLATSLIYDEVPEVKYEPNKVVQPPNVYPQQFQPQSQPPMQPQSQPQFNPGYQNNIGFPNINPNVQFPPQQNLRQNQYPQNFQQNPNYPPQGNIPNQQPSFNIPYQQPQPQQNVQQNIPQQQVIKQNIQSEAFNNPNSFNQSYFPNQIPLRPSSLENSKHQFIEISQERFSPNAEDPKLNKSNSFNLLEESESNDNVSDKKFEYIAVPKFQTNEILVFIDNQITTIKYDKNHFSDQSYFPAFPAHLRSVNLGSSIFCCGGNANKSLVKKAFIIMIYQDGKDLTCNISNFGDMKEGREKHNLIYLPNKDAVIAASGMLNQNVEIADLKSQKWESLPSLKEVRANGTICYINNRFVYIIGGCKVENKQAIYLNSIEVLDMENINLGWNLVDMSMFDPMHVKISAMGLIHVSRSKIMLFGGYDGKKNDNECKELEFDLSTGRIKSYKAQDKIQFQFVFPSNAFIKLGHEAYNFEYSGACVAYDYENHSFRTLK